MNLRGTLPTLILEALEDKPDHGYSISQRIKERSRGVLGRQSPVGATGNHGRGKRHGIAAQYG